MDFYELVEKRRTVRDFTETAVSRDKIRRVLEAGLLAPTYNHLREWDFILVRDQTVRLAVIEAEKLPENCDIEELQRVFAGHDRLAREMYLDAIPKQKRMLWNAPEWLFVVFKPKTRIAESTRVYDLNCLASAWCCIENVLLAMAAEDLYGVTYIPKNTGAVKTVLGVPEPLEIAALIAFGYRAGDARIPLRKSADLADRLHCDSWGKKQA